MAKSIVQETQLRDLPLKGRGKVRDIYDLGDALLIVATDRISAFDVVMTDPIPDKGKVLTQLSAFWFEKTKDIVPHHLISTNVDSFPSSCLPFRDLLSGRSMLVKKADPLPVECIVRGYLSGSGWKDYSRSGSISGISLPHGMVESQKIDQPIFTPSTKAEVGDHDEAIDFQMMSEMVGRIHAEKLRDISIALYIRGREFAKQKGIIIADTKFEFGMIEGEIVLIDEAMTPDSSRFWPMSEYRPGSSQKSFDKQFLRDYLLSIKWDQKPPPPPLPNEIIEKTRERYIEALTRITGKGLD